MTDLLQRLDVRTATDGGDVAPPGWLTGLGAGLAAAAAGAVACAGIAVLVWLSGEGGSFAGALRSGLVGWLLGHGHQITVSATGIAMVPLGMTLVAGWLLVRASSWAAITSRACRRGQVAGVVGSCALAYSTVVLVVAVLCSGGGVEVGLLRGPLVTAGLALVASTVGAVRGSGSTTVLADRLPAVAVPVLRGSAVGVLVLFGSASIVLAAALGIQVETLRQVLGALDPGLLGGALLVVLCLAVLPNVVLLTVAVVLGPGVSLGAATSITLTSVSVGPLPAVPWLAAVPGSGAQPALVSALAALPALAGLVAGAVAVRCMPVLSIDRAAGRGGVAGLLAGLLVAAAVLVAGGAVGPGRMAEVGAPAVEILAVSVASLAVGGVVGGAVMRLLGRA
ncbi:MAG: DUF6350 family protein [Actinomycetota bacterium]|nr:DUF6350 family protein [Actinomycetota bacterium]